MPEISAALVKRLRNETQSGMMECKKALLANEGDVAAAKIWLRKRGLASAERREARATKEGMVGLCAQGRRGALVELSAETDFVALNDSFQDFLESLARTALEGECSCLESLQQAQLGEHRVDVALQELIVKTGENLRLRRVKTLSVEKGLVVCYLHARTRPSVGKIGVLVGLGTDSEGGEVLAEEGKKLAMHIAAMRPRAVRRSDLPSEMVERERDIIHARSVASAPQGAPLEKIVAGRLEKFFRSVVLEEQNYALDESISVKSMVSDLETRLGQAVVVESFVCFAAGDFAEEEG